MKIIPDNVSDEEAMAIGDSIRNASMEATHLMEQLLPEDPEMAILALLFSAASLGGALKLDRKGFMASAKDTWAMIEDIDAKYGRPE